MCIEALCDRGTCQLPERDTRMYGHLHLIGATPMLTTGLIFTLDPRPGEHDEHYEYRHAHPIQLLWYVSHRSSRYELR